MSGIPAVPFGLTLITTAAALLVMMAVTFAVALKAGRHSVVDTAWGLGIALAAVVSLLASAGHGQPGPPLPAAGRLGLLGPAPGRLRHLAQSRSG